MICQMATLLALLSILLNSETKWPSNLQKHVFLELVEELLNFSKLFIFLIFIFLLFIYAYNAWVISPPKFLKIKNHILNTFPLSTSFFFFVVSFLLQKGYYEKRLAKKELALLMWACSHSHFKWGKRTH
jgi:hypothetical protein